MSPTAANAICLPSGEITGRTMPSAWRGVVEVKSRLRCAYAVSARVTCIVAAKSIVCAAAAPAVRLRILPSDTYQKSVGDAHDARNANTFSLPVSGWPSISKRLAPGAVT